MPRAKYGPTAHTTAFSRRASRASTLIFASTRTIRFIFRQPAIGHLCRIAQKSLDPRPRQFRVLIAIIAQLGTRAEKDQARYFLRRFSVRGAKDDLLRRICTRMLSFEYPIARIVNRDHQRLSTGSLLFAAVDAVPTSWWGDLPDQHRIRCRH